MNPTMPIAEMLALPELTLTGCTDGIEIVMLCELPEEYGAVIAASEDPPPAAAQPDTN